MCYTYNANGCENMDMKKMKHIRNLKIRIKALLGIIADSVFLFTMGGTIGTIIYGKENAVKELSSSLHDVVLDTDIDPLIELVDKITIAKKFDATNCDELIDSINKMDNLNCVEIFNAQRLTDDAINALNNSGLKEVTLIFNREDTLRKYYANNRFDLNKFSNKSIIKEVKFSDTVGYEIDSFIFLNYFIN